MKNSWEVAKFLIEAKKDIDSIVYIGDHLFEIPTILRKEYVDRIRNDFYINTCNVLDEYIIYKDYDKNQKKIFKHKNSKNIEKLYYERNKNSAHSDEDYRSTNYNSYYELIKELKSQLQEVFITCRDILPNNITLNFFPHDKIMFRLINKIDNLEEERIKKSKYMDHKEGFFIGEMKEPRQVVYDFRELRGLSKEEKEKFAILIDSGLNFYEFQQNVQDFYILVNLTFNKNMWSENIEQRVNDYKDLCNSGIIDKYDRPRKVYNVISKNFMHWIRFKINKIWFIDYQDFWRKGEAQ